MSSFSCPHFDFATSHCSRTGKDCTPAMPGCVLFGKCVTIADQQPPRRKRPRRVTADRPKG